MENMMGADLKERNAGFDSTLEVLKAEPIVPPIRKLDKESSAVYLPKREGLALKLPKYETIVPMKKLEATSSRADLAKPEAISPKREIKSKARKSRLGDRITALQELACPFGKTDTASVLFEAIAYIKFLQDQVEVLSACAPRNIQSTGRSEEHAYRSLRSRGLCLVPVEQVTHIKEHAYHNLGSRLCFLPTEQVAHIKADAPNHSPPPAKPISDSVVIDIRQDENLLNQLPDSKFLVPSSLKHAQVVQAAYEDNVVSRRGIITCFHAVALTLMLVILYLRSERVPQRPGFLGC